MKKKLIKDLTKGQKTELWELHDGEYKTIRELSSIFNINESVLRWFFNYKGFKQKHTIAVRAWMKKNPKKVKITQKKAVAKYRKLHKKEIEEKTKQKYWSNPEYYRKKQREYYKKGRSNKNK